MTRATAAAAAVLDLPIEKVRVSVAGILGAPRSGPSDAEIHAALATGGSLRAAARALGIADSTLRNRLNPRRSKKST